MTDKESEVYHTILVNCEAIIDNFINAWENDIIVGKQAHDLIYGITPNLNCYTMKSQLKYLQSLKSK